MANFRSSSCPVDPWVQESDTPPEDRAKSALGGQGQDESNGSLNAEVSVRLSKNTDLNRAKVNQWVDLKSKEKEKANPNALGGSKLFSQRHLSVSVAPESSGITRPQTEPGRTRTQTTSEDVKNLTRQSVHGVVTGSGEARTDKKETEEGWVLVETSTSATVMPFDCDEEGNVLVRNPNKDSEQTNKILENEKLAGTTKLHFTNKFGSTFKVLPEARDNSAPVTGGESSGISGAAGKFLSTPTGKGKKTSIGNVLTFATSISKWKQGRADKAKSGFATLDPQHRALLQAESDNIKTEIPEAMMKTIKEEAYKIVLKTTQTYRSQIGSKHKLTTEAYESLKELREELLRT